MTSTQFVTPCCHRIRKRSNIGLIGFQRAPHSRSAAHRMVTWAYMRLSRFFVVAALCVVSAFADDSVRRGPGFSLPDVNMKQHDLYDYRGKVVLLEFMKTNCGHCQTLTGVFEKLRARYGDKIAVLSVVMPPDTLNDVNGFANRFGVKYPILLDAGQVAASYFRITPRNPKPINLPTIYVIDPKGMIRNEMVFDDDSKKAQFEEAGLTAVIEKAMK
jgi:peroxiredoxin